jgi:hypothetical protein
VRLSVNYCVRLSVKYCVKLLLTLLFFLSLPFAVDYNGRA